MAGVKKARSIFIAVAPWAIAIVILYLYRSVYAFYQSQKTVILLTLLDIACLFDSSVIVNRLLIPKLLYRKKILVFILSIIALIIIQSLLIKTIQKAWYSYAGTLPKEAYDVFDTFTYQVFNTWLVAFLGFICICFFRVITDHYISQKKYEVLLREKAETELDFLKAQVNPHFLFNSINSIYGSIDKANTTARDTVLKFSEMLRYQLYECSANTITIDKEIKYLLNYVELQKLRMENITVNVNIQPTVRGFEIAPLLFIPFVENAFKYVSNHEHTSNKIDIALSMDNSYLKFYVHNTKEMNHTIQLMDSKGIGINNVKRRLELLYPSKHAMEISENEKDFTVTLKIDLHEA